MTYQLHRASRIANMHFALIAFHDSGMSLPVGHFVVVRSPNPIIMSHRGLQRCRAYPLGGGYLLQVSDPRTHFMTVRSARRVYSRALRRWRRRLGV